MDASICGRLFDARGYLGNACVNVSGGVIASVTTEPRSDEVYRFDQEGLVIVPGFIDLHVHLRGLELSYKEDEESGTKAALSAGITLVVDMPNTRPRLSTPSALKAKLDALKRTSYVDYGVYAGIPDEPDTVGELTKQPIAGFKVYPEDMAVRPQSVSKVLSSGRLVVLHPELPEAERLGYDENDHRALERGCWMEGAGLALLLTLGAPRRLHVTHASCPTTIDLARSLGATIDVTPHHLIYDSNSRGCHFRVSPPIRDSVTRDLLVRYVIEGLVDAIASDHAPHSPQEKASWPHCPPGIPWLGLWPLSLFRLVSSGALSLPEFLRLTSLGPARVLGIDGLYGLIEPGYRANITVLNTRARGRFTATYSKASYLHAFMEEVYAAVSAVFVGGTLAALEGEPLLRPPVRNPFEVAEGG